MKIGASSPENVPKMLRVVVGLMKDVKSLGERDMWVDSLYIIEDPIS
jgi:hypothetical protein